ncbi:haloacid dehalogenase superfamily, subfamily IA, variant 3 with third motif having DD or ED/haloacid dehalogenase superfamily, subfamily IA, variant 1 with third motif having Dx(3-4)D or Dx(3-4)E [Allokutzneria albata]|uniref:D,D-heptose 1,7-bisphosphate phosphatase n=2 Tax=Allokutzneria albata TaxID=211114 RepID=A0A1G9UGX3_ALLAB|nr:haloacid dehalogenase superfamily, subfamily IA, variant 3 with third motif having DD or ED/haloacid dehalogenase superfamily, subfamily IA, variant 1 with third motif having Dx(3-4)D or Dx(3-4)E [Allokutzneria albata]
MSMEHVAARAVLFDRDGTLVEDVPYNGNPSLVRPMPGAVAAVAAARAGGLAVGVVSNQSGIGRGLLTWDEVGAVNARVEEVFGGFDTWQICPHTPDEGCACRKPEPGMVLAACAELGVLPEETVFVGDIEADVLAAERAGTRSVLVPTPVTLPDEVHRAETVAADLPEAVRLALS